MNRTRALLRAIRGPVMLMTLGTLFAIDHFGRQPIYRTWPVLLIVYGAIWFVERLAAGGGNGQGRPVGGPA